MSEFTEPLKVTPVGDRRWMLLDSFAYELGSEGSGIILRVPKGFITDFASVPRPLWWLYPPWDRYGKAAILHDFLYSTQPVIRMLADAVFYEAMITLKVPWYRARTIWSGVRMFGWIAWNRNHKKIKRQKQ